jgi:hypothetical protein
MSPYRKKLLKNIEARVLPYSVLILMVVAGLTTMFLVLPPQHPVRADSFDEWGSYKIGYIDNPINNHQILINITKTAGGDMNCSGAVNDNFSDIRFADVNNNSLSYWHTNYNYSEGDYREFWVKLPDTIETDEKILIYYNNSEAATVSNGTNTFVIFDDFESYANQTTVLNEPFSVYKTDASDRAWVIDNPPDYGFTGNVVELYESSTSTDGSAIFDITEFASSGNYQLHVLLYLVNDVCMYFSYQEWEDSVLVTDIGKMSVDSGFSGFTKFSNGASYLNPSPVAPTIYDSLYSFSYWGANVSGTWYHGITNNGKIHNASNSVKNIPDGWNFGRFTNYCQKIGSIYIDDVFVTYFAGEGNNPSWSSFSDEKDTESSTEGSYTISGLDANTRFPFSGEADTTVWSTDNITMSIHTNLSGTSENCTDIFLDFKDGIDADLDETTFSLAIINTADGDWGDISAVLAVTGNMTINSTTWTAGVSTGWAHGTNPFPIDAVNVTLAVRLRVSIPVGKATGTYTTDAWEVLWKVIS